MLHCMRVQGQRACLELAGTARWQQLHTAFERSLLSTGMTQLQTRSQNSDACYRRFENPRSYQFGGAQCAESRDHAAYALCSICSFLGAGYSARAATAVAAAMLGADAGVHACMRGFLAQELSLAELAIDALECAAHDAADLRKQVEDLRAVAVNTRAETDRAQHSATPCKRGQSLKHCDPHRESAARQPQKASGGVSVVACATASFKELAGAQQ